MAGQGAFGLSKVGTLIKGDYGRIARGINKISPPIDTLKHYLLLQA